MNLNDNVLVFNTDDELTDFCLELNPVISQSEVNGQIYNSFDYPFTQDYMNCLNNGQLVMVNDPCSKVMKHGCVNRGLITKKLSNLATYDFD